MPIPLKEKYVGNVYNALSDNADGFSKTQDEFKEAMKDSAYAKKVYNALSDIFDDFDKSEDEFLGSVYEAKKVSNGQANGKPLTTEEPPVKKKEVASGDGGKDGGEDSYKSKLSFEGTETQYKDIEVAPIATDENGVPTRSKEIDLVLGLDGTKPYTKEDMDNLRGRLADDGSPVEMDGQLIPTKRVKARIAKDYSDYWGIDYNSAYNTIFKDRKPSVYTMESYSEAPAITRTKGTKRTDKSNYNLSGRREKLWLKNADAGELVNTYKEALSLEQGSFEDSDSDLAVRANAKTWLNSKSGKVARAWHKLFMGQAVDNDLAIIETMAGGELERILENSGVSSIEELNESTKAKAKDYYTTQSKKAYEEGVAEIKEYSTALKEVDGSDSNYDYDYTKADDLKKAIDKQYYNLRAKNKKAIKLMLDKKYHVHSQVDRGYEDDYNADMKVWEESEAKHAGIVANLIGQEYLRRNPKASRNEVGEIMLMVIDKGSYNDYTKVKQDRIREKLSIHDLVMSLGRNAMLIRGGELNKAPEYTSDDMDALSALAKAGKQNTPEYVALKGKHQAWELQKIKDKGAKDAYEAHINIDAIAPRARTHQIVDKLSVLLDEGNSKNKAMINEIVPSLTPNGWRHIVANGKVDADKLTRLVEMHPMFTADEAKFWREHGANVYAKNDLKLANYAWLNEIGRASFGVVKSSVLGLADITRLRNDEMRSEESLSRNVNRTLVDIEKEAEGRYEELMKKPDKDINDYNSIADMKVYMSATGGVRKFIVGNSATFSQVTTLGLVTALTSGVSRTVAGAKYLKAGNAIGQMSGISLSVIDDNLKEANRLYGGEGEELEKYLYASLATGITAMVENIIPERRYVQGFVRYEKKSLQKAVRDFGKGKLSRKAFENQVKIFVQDWFVESGLSYGGEILEETAEPLAKGIVDMAISTGQGDMAKVKYKGGQVLGDMLEGGKEMAVNGFFTAIWGGYGKARSNRISYATQTEIVENPEFRGQLLGVLEKQVKEKQLTQEEYQERIDFIGDLMKTKTSENLMRLKAIQEGNGRLLTKSQYDAYTTLMAWETKLNRELKEANESGADNTLIKESLKMVEKRKSQIIDGNHVVDADGLLYTQEEYAKKLKMDEETERVRQANLKAKEEAKVAPKKVDGDGSRRNVTTKDGVTSDMPVDEDGGKNEKDGVVYESPNEEAPARNRETKGGITFEAPQTEQDEQEGEQAEANTDNAVSENTDSETEVQTDTETETQESVGTTEQGGAEATTSVLDEEEAPKKKLGKTAEKTVVKKTSEELGKLLEEGDDDDDDDAGSKKAKFLSSDVTVSNNEDGTVDYTYSDGETKTNVTAEEHQANIDDGALVIDKEDELQQKSDNSKKEKDGVGDSSKLDLSASSTTVGKDDLDNDRIAQAREIIENLRDENGEIPKENIEEFKKQRKVISKLARVEETEEQVLKRLEGQKLYDIFEATTSGKSNITSIATANVLGKLLEKEGYTKEEIQYLTDAKIPAYTLFQRFKELNETKQKSKKDTATPSDGVSGDRSQQQKTKDSDNTRTGEEDVQGKKPKSAEEKVDRKKVVHENASSTEMSDASREKFGDLTPEEIQDKVDSGEMEIIPTEKAESLYTLKGEDKPNFKKYGGSLENAKATAKKNQEARKETERRVAEFKKKKDGDTETQKKDGDVIGVAFIDSLKVLIDAVNQRNDTLPHEYAHHYIRMFRNTPIVQEAIKRFGSEEKLVQAIGEQVARQKGEAYNWWKKFISWALNILSDKQVLQVLTDSFLTARDLSQVGTTTTSDVNVFEGGDMDFDAQNASLIKKLEDKITVLYPNIKLYYQNGFIDVEKAGTGLALLQMSNRRKKEFESQVAKKRPDLVERNEVDNVIDNINEYLANVPQNKRNKQTNAIFKWLFASNIILPEDGEKMTEAFRLAELNNLNLDNYNNPNDIIERFVKTTKAKRIDPNTVKEFSNKKSLEKHGVEIFNVEDTKEGQRAVRKIMDTHWGEDSNCWCLLYKDKDGKITDGAWEHWSESYKGKKKIAFQDGKIIAFYAGGEWWDRSDANSDGIPITSKTNDGTGRKAKSELNEKTGRITTRLYYKGNKQNGLYQEWDKNGKLIIEENYKDGEYDGVVKEYNEKNGKPITEINYKEGEYDGSYKEWHENGKLATEINFDYGEYDGVVKEWHENGKLAREANYKDGKLHGGIKEWHENGKLAREANYKDGRGHGGIKEWHENGKLATEATYNNGTLNGTSKWWNVKGKLTSESTYKNGRLDGTSKMYHSNGKVFTEDNYKYGKKHGSYKSWNEDGTPIREENYKNDKKHGVLKLYRNGKLVLEENYKDGNLHGVVKDWDTKGNLISEELYENDKLVSTKKVTKKKKGKLSAVKPKSEVKTEREKVRYDKLIKKLKKAFPKVKLLTKEEFDKKPNPRVLKKGDVIYGAKFSDGSIYLNENFPSLETPIHEFSHVFEAMFPERWAKLVKKYRNTKGFKLAIKEVEKNSLYDDLSQKEIESEALNLIIGRRGAEYFSGSALSRFLKDVNDLIKKVLNKWGIIDVTDEDLFEMEVRDVLDEMLYQDVLQGLDDFYGAIAKIFPQYSGIGSFVKASDVRKKRKKKLKKRFGYRASEAISKELFNFFPKDDGVAFSDEVYDKLVNAIAEVIPNKTHIASVITKQPNNVAKAVSKVSGIKIAKNVKLDAEPLALLKKAGYEMKRVTSPVEAEAKRHYYRTERTIEGVTHLDETVCTINSIKDRLGSYPHVSWIVRSDWQTVKHHEDIMKMMDVDGFVDGTKLGKRWQAYLSKQGLDKNGDGNFYVKGLEKDARDPYSTSVMVLLVNKYRAKNVSRYNHEHDEAVDGDYVFGKSLDGIVEGLHESLYAYEGIDIQNKPSSDVIERGGKFYAVGFNDGSTKVGDGFVFNYKHGFVELDKQKERVAGEFVFNTQNGTITLAEDVDGQEINNFDIKKHNGKYVIITSDERLEFDTLEQAEATQYSLRQNSLYAIKASKNASNSISLGFETDMFEEGVDDLKITYEGKKIIITSEKSTNAKRVEMEVENGAIISFKTDAKDVDHLSDIFSSYITQGNMEGHGRLKELTLSDATDIDNRFLEKLVISGISDSGKVDDDTTGLTINLPKVKTIESDFAKALKNPSVINAPSVTDIGNDFLSNYGHMDARGFAISNIYMPKLVNVGNHFLYFAKKMGDYNFDSLSEVGDGFLRKILSIDKIDFPKLSEVGNYFMFELDEYKGGTELNFPSLINVEVGFMKYLQGGGIKSLKFPLLENVDSEFLSSINSNISDADFTNLMTAGSQFLNNISIDKIKFPSLVSVGNYFMGDNKDLKEISVPELAYVGGSFLKRNTALESLKIPRAKKASFEAFMVRNKNANVRSEIDRIKKVAENYDLPFRVVKPQSKSGKQTQRQRERTLKVAEHIKNNLGINVVADAKEMADKLKELGYDSLEAMAGAFNSEIKALFDSNPEVANEIYEELGFVSNREDALKNNEGFSGRFEDVIKLKESGLTYKEIVQKIKEKYGVEYSPNRIGQIYNTYTKGAVLPSQKRRTQEAYAEYIKRDGVDKSLGGYLNHLKTVKETNQNFRDNPLGKRGDKVDFLSTPNGEVYGFAVDGEIYIDPEHLNSNTLLHENYHIFEPKLKALAKSGNKVAKAIIAKRNSIVDPMMDDFKKDIKSGEYGDFYSQKEGESDADWTERLRGEVMARLVGDNAESFLDKYGVDAKKAKAWYQEFLDWVKGFFGISDTESIEDMSIKEFLDYTTNHSLEKRSFELSDNVFQKAKNLLDRILGGNEFLSNHIENISFSANAEEFRDFNQKKKLYKKAFGSETVANLISEKMPTAFDQEDKLIKWLKKKIPAKSGMPYIIREMGSMLEAEFLTEKNIESEVATPSSLSPYELLNLAGYNVKETKTLDELSFFETYYKRGVNLICTLKTEGSKISRLQESFIMFITKDDAKETKKASELTQENLTESWKEYLEKEGRKNDDGTYNLDGLRHDRRDPFSTSVLSIQVNKKNGYLKIISRYNHTLETGETHPDSTFNKDLNKLASGLEDSLYEYFGVEKAKTSVKVLPPKITQDANGNYYHYGAEDFGVFYGDGFIVDGGIETILDNNKERMVNGFTISQQTGKAKWLFGDNNFMFGNDIKKVQFGKKGAIKLIYDKYEVDLVVENGMIVEAYSENLKSLAQEGGTDTGNLFSRRTSIRKAVFPSLEKISVVGNITFRHLDAPNLREIESDGKVREVKIEDGIQFNAPKLSNTKGVALVVYGNLELPNLRQASDITVHRGTLSAPVLREANDIGLERSATLKAEKLHTADQIRVHNNSSLDAPDLVTAMGLRVRNGSSVNVKEARSIKHISIHDNCDVNFPNLRDVLHIDVSESSKAKVNKLQTAQSINVSVGSTLEVNSLEDAGVVDVRSVSKLVARSLTKVYRKTSGSYTTAGNLTIWRAELVAPRLVLVEEKLTLINPKGDFSSIKRAGFITFETTPSNPIELKNLTIVGVAKGRDVKDRGIYIKHGTLSLPKINKVNGSVELTSAFSELIAPKLREIDGELVMKNEAKIKAPLKKVGVLELTRVEDVEQAEFNVPKTITEVGKIKMSNLNSYSGKVVSNVAMALHLPLAKVGELSINSHYAPIKIDLPSATIMNDIRIIGNFSDLNLGAVKIVKNRLTIQHYGKVGDIQKVNLSSLEQAGAIKLDKVETSLDKLKNTAVDGFVKTFRGNETFRAFDITDSIVTANAITYFGYDVSVKNSTLIALNLYKIAGSFQINGIPTIETPKLVGIKRHLLLDYTSGDIHFPSLKVVGGFISLTQRTESALIVPELVATEAVNINSKSRGVYAPKLKYAKKVGISGAVLHSNSALGLKVYAPIIKAEGGRDGHGQIEDTSIQYTEASQGKNRAWQGLKSVDSPPKDADEQLKKAKEWIDPTPKQALKDAEKNLKETWDDLMGNNDDPNILGFAMLPEDKARRDIENVSKFLKALKDYLILLLDHVEPFVNLRDKVNALMDKSEPSELQSIVNSYVARALAQDYSTAKTRPEMAKKVNEVYLKLVKEVRADESLTPEIRRAISTALMDITTEVGEKGSGASSYHSSLLNSERYEAIQDRIKGVLLNFAKTGNWDNSSSFENLQRNSMLTGGAEEYETTSVHNMQAQAIEIINEIGVDELLLYFGYGHLPSTYEELVRHPSATQMTPSEVAVASTLMVMLNTDVVAMNNVSEQSQYANFLTARARAQGTKMGQSLNMFKLGKQLSLLNRGDALGVALTDDNMKGAKEVEDAINEVNTSKGDVFSDEMLGEVSDGDFSMSEKEIGTQPQPTQKKEKSEPRESTRKESPKKKRRFLSRFKKTVKDAFEAGKDGLVELIDVCKDLIR